MARRVASLGPKWLKGASRAGTDRYSNWVMPTQLGLLACRDTAKMSGPTHWTPLCSPHL